MSATSSGHRAAILREVEQELNRTDENATTPPTFWDYASDVARRMVHLANEDANPSTPPAHGKDYLGESPDALLICTRHDRRAMVFEGKLLHVVDNTPCTD
jgi:hypothetical protein